MTLSALVPLAFATALDSSAAPRPERVELASGGETLVGHLYLPAGASAAQPVPAVVVTGAWTTVKEQMAGRYARELAARGFAALAFDFRGWGESGGALRELESPALKIQDIHAAFNFLAGRPEVDHQRLAGLGICASAGYMAAAAATNSRLGSLALVAPWLHDGQIVKQIYGGAEGVAKLIATGREAAARTAANGELVRIPVAGADANALMGNVPYYSEPHRGLIPAWPNRFNLATWEGWLSFDGIAPASRLGQPTLIVHSEAAAIPEGAHRFFARLEAPKRELWLDGVTQFDFYDGNTPITRAADEVAAHFRSTFTGPPAHRAALPASGEAETARVISVVSSIPLAVDLARYDLAEGAFAPQVVIDYTSLWGGSAQTMTPAELMAAWRGIVPGFDATWHELSEIRAEVEGQRATATAFVDGRHWLNGELWRPVGTYRWELEKLNGRWQVTRMTFHLHQEIGDRALAGRAQERARR